MNWLWLLIDWMFPEEKPTEEEVLDELLKANRNNDVY
jgi:hypothetical protein